MFHHPKDSVVLGTEFENGECLVWWNWFSTPSIDIQTGRAARPAELRNERVTPATRHGSDCISR